jgi:hypothetical protein
MNSIQMVFNLYFGAMPMTNQASNAAAASATPPTAAESKKSAQGNRREVDQVVRPGPVRAEEQGRFCVPGRGLEKAQAQRDVDAVLKGRQI